MRMHMRAVIRILAVCAFLSARLLLALPARAETYVFEAEGTGTEEAAGAWDRFRAALDGEAADLVGGVDLADPVSAAEALGGRGPAQKMKTLLRQAFVSSAQAVIPEAAPLFALLLLAAAAKTADTEEKVREPLMRVLRLAAAVAVFVPASGLLELTRGVTGTVCRLAELLVPVTEGICLVGGGVSEGAAARVGMMLVLTVAEEIAGRVLVPAAGVLLGLTAVSGGKGFAASVSAGLRTFLLRAWQILTLGVSILLGSQSVLGRAADSAGIRTARLAVTSFVPVAGSVLSEAWGTFVSGVRLLRGAAGIGGILALTAAVLPTAVRLLTWQWAFGIGKCAAQALELPELAPLFDGARGVAELLSSFALYTLFLFVLELAAFAGLGR